MQKKQRNLLIGLLTLAICASIVPLALSFRQPAEPAGAPTDAFYTTDDGATTFVDSAEKLPPFDHHGQPAVKAIVYSTDGGAHRWIQYLFRYTNSEKAGLSALKHPSAPMGMGEVKKPGAAHWIPITDPRASAITYPKPPANAGTGAAQELFP